MAPAAAAAAADARHFEASPEARVPRQPSRLGQRSPASCHQPAAACASGASGASATRPKSPFHAASLYPFETSPVPASGAATTAEPAPAGGAAEGSLPPTTATGAKEPAPSPRVVFEDEQAATGGRAAAPPAATVHKLSQPRAAFLTSPETAAFMNDICFGSFAPSDAAGAPAAHGGTFNLYAPGKPPSRGCCGAAAEQVFRRPPPALLPTDQWLVVYCRRQGLELPHDFLAGLGAAVPALAKTAAGWFVAPALACAAHVGDDSDDSEQSEEGPVAPAVSPPLRLQQMQQAQRPPQPLQLSESSATSESLSPAGQSGSAGSASVGGSSSAADESFVTPGGGGGAHEGAAAAVAARRRRQQREGEMVFAGQRAEPAYKSGPGWAGARARRRWRERLAEDIQLGGRGPFAVGGADDAGPWGRRGAGYGWGEGEDEMAAAAVAGGLVERIDSLLIRTEDKLRALLPRRGRRGVAERYAVRGERGGWWAAAWGGRRRLEERLMMAKTAHVQQLGGAHVDEGN
jgi:hypothetical protein